MPRFKTRFVTVCQQILALGAVLAVLAPAANVISLDVVGTIPGAPTADVAQPPAPQPHDRAAAPAVPASDHEKSRVEAAPVEPVVEEVPLAPAADQPADKGRHTILSEPETVTGYGAVGVTWGHGQQLEDDQITVLVRTRTDGTWTKWSAIEYHEEHSPDPDSAEGRKARPGTDPLLVGEVDEVQAKAVTKYGEIPDDVTMSVIEPGASKDTDVEEPAIDTSKLDTAKRDQAEDETVTDETADEALQSSDGEIALQAGSYTPKPQIYSRAQWGADEKMRDAGSLHYYEVHAGFVHHTVNANNYSRSDVPGIIRSIYAYHTQSKGWSDIGYNFLVDRFGRIWEGRYGGVDRPVVGAHTLGYNDYSFAMSAIGNYETAQPTSAMLDAYGKLFAWKLSLHGIDAADTSQKVGPKTFKAINGHRDAGQTACPGRYLYAKIPKIRELAAGYQADWTGRDRTTDIVGSGTPDLLVRRTSDKAGFILPTAGTLKWRSGRVASSTGWSGYDVVVPSPDLDGDGKADIVVRNKSGNGGLRRGSGDGEFSGTVKKTSMLAGYDQVAAVGDLNGDKLNDLVARQISTGKLYVFRGDGTGAFRRTLGSADWSGYTMTIGAGDLNGDGKADVVARDKAGALWLHTGTGKSLLGARTKMAGSWGGYDAITGGGDYTGDGKADLYVRRASDGTASIFPGRGDGTLGYPFGPFGRVSGLTSLSGPGTVVRSVAPDVVGVRGDRLVVVAHMGSQNTLPPISVGSAFSSAGTVLNVGDWDRDGYGDVITRPSGSGTLELRRGLPGGKLAAPVSIATGFSGVSLLTAVGDTTGDGWPDLMGQPKGSALRIYPGNGVNGLRASYVAHAAVSATTQLGAGRWDGDGAPDNLFRVDNKLKVIRGNGPGGLTGSSTTIPSVDLTRYDWVLSPGDVNRDGRADLVVREKTTGYLWLLAGNSGGYRARRFLAEGYGGYDLAG